MAIEVKVPGETPTDIQFAKLARWGRAGAIAFWVDTHEGVIDTIRAIIYDKAAGISGKSFTMLDTRFTIWYTGGWRAGRSGPHQSQEVGMSKPAVRYETRDYDLDAIHQIGEELCPSDQADDSLCILTRKLMDSINDCKTRGVPNIHEGTLEVTFTAEEWAAIDDNVVDSGPVAGVPPDTQDPEPMPTPENPDVTRVVTKEFLHEAEISADIYWSVCGEITDALDDQYDREQGDQRLTLTKFQWRILSFITSPEHEHKEVADEG